MEDSSLLISEFNEYITKITEFRKEIILLFNKTDIEGNSNIDKSKLNDILIKLKENLKKLEDLKEKMELCGFDTPYVGVGTLKGKGENDIYEIKHYSQYLKKMVDEKKGALERVKYAIVSHKIAIGNITNRAGNINLIKNLPYDGLYDELLINLPSIYIKTHKKILELFELNYKGVLTSITMNIIYLENGRRKFKRLKIEEEDYDKYIAEHYKDAIITNLKHNYTKNKLISDKYVKKTLILAYIFNCYSEIEQSISYELNKQLTIKQQQMIKEYLEIKSKYNLEYIDGGVLDYRKLDEYRLKTAELYNELEKKGLYKNGKLVDELEEGLKTEKEIYENICYNIITKNIGNDLFNYYLHNTPDDRSRSSMYPTLLITPSIDHLKWIKKADNCNIDNNSNSNIDKLKILNLKFIFEKEFIKYNMPLKNVGGVVLYLYYNWDIVKKYGYNKEEIEECLKEMSLNSNLMNILKNNNIDTKKVEKYNIVKKKRTKKFLNALNDL